MPRREADPREEALRDLLLVAVTDRRRCRGDLVAACEAAVRGGATAVLLRDRDLPRAERRRLAVRLRRVTARYGASLIVHSDAALAREVRADGVHLDGTAGPREVAAARRRAGKGRIVGVSTHSAAEVAEAEAAGADYVFLGPIFRTSSHPGRGIGSGALLGGERVPRVAIGGIDARRAGALIRPGVALRVAAVEAILGAEDPAAAAGGLLETLSGHAELRRMLSRPGPADERSVVAGFLAEMAGASGLSLGPGDDAVVFRDGGVAVASDLTVEGIHYERGTAGRAAGFKAAGRALSDLAAVGARPVGLMVSLAVPRGLHAVERARGLQAGAAAAARAVGTCIVGGDTKETGGTETIAVTALGRLEGPPPLARAGGRPGDALFVSGPLGGSIRGRHLRPRPRIDVGLDLRRRALATACIDVSDGLAADLHRLCRASGTGALLGLDRLPVHPDARRRGSVAPTERALHDGEDYELLFAVPPDRVAEVEARGVARRPAHRIGRLVHRDAGVVVQGGMNRLWPLPDRGWVHFRAH